MKIQSSVAQIFHYIFARQLLLAGKLTIMIGIGFFSRSYNAEFLSQSFEVRFLSKQPKWLFCIARKAFRSL